MFGSGNLVRQFTPNGYLGNFRFDVKGTSDPNTSSWSGSLKRFVSTVAYSATGKYTITFTSDFRPANTPFFYLSTITDGTTGVFAAVQVGDYDATNRQVVVQTISGSMAAAAITAPATAGAGSVVLHMSTSYSTGK